MSSRGIFSGSTRSVLLVAALFLCALALPTNAVAGASVSGAVTTAATADPLAGVEVCAHPVDPETFWEPCDYTDSGGGYLLDLDSGQYRIEFLGQPLGYVREYFDDSLRWFESDLVTVGSVPVEGIDAALAVGGRIEGEVVARATGEPTMASVYANSVSTEGLGGWTETDFNGRYLLDGLPPAEYRVEFSGYDQNLLPQYYSLTSFSFFADWVAVTPGSVQGGVDAELETGGRIEGTVRLAADNSALPEVRVCAEPTGIGGELHCVSSDVDGGYVIEHLPPSVYKVWFEPAAESGLAEQYWNRRPEWNYADAIEVQGELTTTGIDGFLGPPLLPAPEASLPPIAAPLKAAIGQKPKRCKKGFRRKLVKGKRRCVRKRAHRHRRRQDR